MTPDTKLLGETIFKALLIVTDKLYHEADQTIVEKTMLDAGVKQSIFLSSLLRDDEKVEGSDPLPLMMSPIFVNLRVKKQDKTYIEGTISSTVIAGRSFRSLC